MSLCKLTRKKISFHGVDTAFSPLMAHFTSLAQLCWLAYYHPCVSGLWFWYKISDQTRGGSSWAIGFSKLVKFLSKAGQVNQDNGSPGAINELGYFLQFCGLTVMLLLSSLCGCFLDWRGWTVRLNTDGCASSVWSFITCQPFQCLVHQQSKLGGLLKLLGSYTWSLKSHQLWRLQVHQNHVLVLRIRLVYCGTGTWDCCRSQMWSSKKPPSLWQSGCFSAWGEEKCKAGNLASSLIWLRLA